MNRRVMSIVIVVCLLIGLLVGAGFSAAASAQASLGNTGVPVKCTVVVPQGMTSTLSCTAADGTSFANGSDVPTGYYLLVTDIVANPANGTASQLYALELHRYAADSDLENIQLITQGGATLGEHFITPYLVLSQGQQMRMHVPSSTPGAMTVYVSGLLTTNVAYVPLIAR